MKSRYIYDAGCIYVLSEKQFQDYLQRAAVRADACPTGSGGTRLTVDSLNITNLTRDDFLTHATLLNPQLSQEIVLMGIEAQASGVTIEEYYNEIAAMFGQPEFLAIRRTVREGIYRAFAIGMGRAELEEDEG